MMHQLVFRPLFLVLAAAFCSISSAQDFSGVRQLVTRRFPSIAGKVVFTPITNSKQETFTLRTDKGKLIVGASSSSAASTGLYHYLNNVCHVSISRNGNNLPKTLRIVPIKGEIRQQTPFRYRYALNYCTYNYSYSFYDWKDFEKELDWMSLNGVNLMLAPMGMEVVWAETLAQLGFDENDIRRFIPGPGYTAWWLMGNLEGWGGPMSKDMIEYRRNLQLKMLKRMRELGIEPVVQGFPGLVPSFFKEKYPSAKLIAQGTWGGFDRPSVLLPSDSALFNKVARVYYERLIANYGRNFHYLGGDLFHEGGNTAGVDVPRTASLVQKQMLNFFPDAKWVLQGWGRNPSPELLSGLDKRHVLLINLSGEISASWESSAEFGSTPWLWGSVNHFGGKTDLGGQLPVIVGEPHRALSMSKGGMMQGIGILPEGINYNPVVYDFALKTAWQTHKPDLDSLLHQYVCYRYGSYDDDLFKAWRVLSRSVYGEFKIKGEGTFESVFCARPSLNVTSVSTWGPKQMQYSTEDLKKALGLFRRAAKRHLNSETYQYDLVDIARQVLANHARTVYGDAMNAYRTKNMDALHANGDLFMNLLLLQDSLLQTNRHFLLSSWLDKASKYGVKQADRQQSLHNAKMLITYWGPDDPATRVHDYANKEWAGLLRDYYLKRWRVFFDNLYNGVTVDEKKDNLNFFAMEKQWADSYTNTNAEPTDNWLAMVDRVIANTMKPYQNAALTVDERVKDLLARMTLDEKIAQMRHIHFKHYNDNGRVNLAKLRNNHTGGLGFGCFEAFPYSSEQYLDAISSIQRDAVDSTRLGIPVIPIIEGIHGIVQDGCTIFPHAIAQAATFNPKLVRSMAQHIGTEMRAIGARQVLAPDLDIARELRWGRVEETFGEDPYLIAQMASNYVEGIQSRGGIATLKHFVAHGTPQGGLNLASVKGGRRELMDVYVKPFEQVIRRTNPGAVMNCYSAYDNEAITGSPYFLRSLLRDSLNFKGYVYADWGSIPMLRYFHHTAANEKEAAQQAIRAGVDLEAGSDYYRTAKQLVSEGKLDETLADSAAAHVLHTKFASGLFDDAATDTIAWRKRIHTPQAISVAKQLADESIVMLENRNNLLPLRINNLRSVAVVGPNAAQVQFGDYSWTSDNKYGITPLDGIRKLVGKSVKINYAPGCDYYSQNTDSIAAAVRMAKESDVTIIAVGTQSMLLARASEPSTSGEGYDLSELTLPGVQQQLVDSIAALGKPFVVVLVTGRPLITKTYSAQPNALLVQWYGGEQAGLSLAEVIFGKRSPAGRLPVSFPKSVGELPVYYNHLPTDKGYYNKKGTISQPGRDYVFSNPYPAYHFGYGLTYTTFGYSHLSLSAHQLTDNDTLTVSFAVRNTGKTDAHEVAQLYVRDMKSSVATPIKQLYGFEKIMLRAGEERKVSMRLPIADLYLHNRDMVRVVEPGDFEIQVGSSSVNIHLRDTLHVADNSAQTASPSHTAHSASPSAVAAKSESKDLSKTLNIRGTVRNVQAFLMSNVRVQTDNASTYTDRNGVYTIKARVGEQLRFTLKGYRTEVLTVREGGIFDIELIAETP